MINLIYVFFLLRNANAILFYLFRLKHWQRNKLQVC